VEDLKEFEATNWDEATLESFLEVVGKIKTSKKAFFVVVLRRLRYNFVVCQVLMFFIFFICFWVFMFAWLLMFLMVFIFLWYYCVSIFTKRVRN
jgi:uncharacterized membrane protein